MSGRGAGDRPLTYAGAYQAARTYLAREIVSEAGGVYMATAKTVGHPPPDRTYWMPLGREREAVFSSSVAPVIGDQSPPYGVSGGSTVLRFRVFLRGTGSADTTVKLYLNNVEIASVTIAAGNSSGGASIVEALADGDVLTVAATAVGSGVTGMTAIAYLAA